MTSQNDNSVVSSDSEVLLRCEHVSKVFCANLKRSLWYGLQDIARDVGLLPGTKRNDGLLYPDSRPLRPGEFWANKDISFELRRGECLGLIGRNGAGKTTLLKMLNGVIKPDTGKITQKGKMGALIALGTGFNPLLSGRENIIANAMVLGLSKREIDEAIDEIIDFSDLRDFIDAPVRNYSSGMQVRLGFSIATVINPDILILDEVLAVGDASFRHKCYHRINKLMKRSAVILVSHSMDYIGLLATSVGLLDRGKMTLYKDVYEGIAAYNEMVSKNEAVEETNGLRVTAHYPPVKAVDVVVPSAVNYGEKLEVAIRITTDEPIEDAIVSFVLLNRNEQNVLCFHTGNNSKRITLPSGKNEICIIVDHLWLHQGDYKWSLNICQHGSIDHLVWYIQVGKVSVNRSGAPIGDIPYLPDPERYSVRSFT